MRAPIFGRAPAFVPFIPAGRGLKGLIVVGALETVSDCGARNWLRDYLLGHLVSLRSFLVWLGLRGRESATYLN